MKLSNHFFLPLFVSLITIFRVDGNPNYMDALAKSILFFQGQRSGRLPTSQQVLWRSSSGLSDGQLAHVCTLVCCSIFLSSKFKIL